MSGANGNSRPPLSLVLPPAEAEALKRAQAQAEALAPHVEIALANFYVKPLLARFVDAAALAISKKGSMTPPEFMQHVDTWFRENAAAVLAEHIAEK